MPSHCNSFGLIVFYLLLLVATVKLSASSYKFTKIITFIDWSHSVRLKVPAKYIGYNVKTLALILIPFMSLIHFVISFIIELNNMGLNEFSDSISL